MIGRGKNSISPRGLPLVILLDSGGRSLRHISTDFALLCHAGNLRPFILGPYLTAAMMPNDQHCNAAAEKKWDALRASGCPLDNLGVLDAVHECFDHDYYRENLVRSKKQKTKASEEPGVVPKDAWEDLATRTVRAHDLS